MNRFDETFKEICFELANLVQDSGFINASEPKLNDHTL